MSHWPRCRPGLCLDFATEFVTVNTLRKPELPTSTWQTHIGSCRLLITTPSCYCHPQLSEQFLCVPKMAKRGTAAIWEVHSSLPWKESSTEGHQASLETPPQTACRPLSQMRLKHLLTQLCAQSVHTVGLQLAHRIKADL